jgi:hypothetical protein
MAISGPIALYANVPIRSEYYQPRRFQIASITLGLTTIITATEDFDYVIGQQIRVLIPVGYGCRQITGQQALVISLPSPTQIEINIDSRGFDPFIAASLSQTPQVIPIGDVNSGAINFGRTNNITHIYGSFINISPHLR